MSGRASAAVYYIYVYIYIYRGRALGGGRGTYPADRGGGSGQGAIPAEVLGAKQGPTRGGGNLPGWGEARTYPMGGQGPTRQGGGGHMGVPDGGGVLVYPASRGGGFHFHNSSYLILIYQNK